jgi:short subunit dehydrogenase-like uncharacterized protein
MLYGSNGFTGDLIARLAVQRGLKPILAGRSRQKIEDQAIELGLDYRVFDLADRSAALQAVGEVGAVLNCAGPFLYTAEPMMEACLEKGTHYLDITGEIPIFEMAAARDARALERTVTLLPGVGVEIAPTDCLAAHLKRRLPSATHLTLAWGSRGGFAFSRGSTLTALEFLGHGAQIRRNGRIESVPVGWKSRLIDFGYGPVRASIFPWPDPFTAFYTTGIRDIQVLFPLPGPLRRMPRTAPYLLAVLDFSPLKALMKRAVRSGPPGPTPKTRARIRGLAWGEVTDDQGRRAVSRLEGPEPGYTWTPIIALDAAQKVLAGAAPPGFMTPGLAFGADFILECADVQRFDVE